MSLSRRIGAVLEWLRIPNIPSHKLLRRRRSSGTLGSEDMMLRLSVTGVRELLGTVQSVFEVFFRVSDLGIYRQALGIQLHYSWSVAFAL